MRRSPARAAGLLAATAVAGGIWVATASAAPTDVTFELTPAPTSVDHAPFCDFPDAPSTEAADGASTAGATAVTFTILPRGC